MNISNWDYKPTSIYKYCFPSRWSTPVTREPCIKHSTNTRIITSVQVATNRQRQEDLGPLDDLSKQGKHRGNVQMFFPSVFFQRYTPVN